MAYTQRKSNAQRIREGMRSHMPLRNEADHAGGIPAQPSGMSKAAKREWDYLVENMDPLMLRRVDAKSLAALCEDEALLTLGYKRFWEMGDGDPMAALFTSPEVRGALNAIRDLAHRLIVERREFGLTPASRSRVDVGKTDSAKNNLNEVLFSRPSQSFELQHPN